MGINLQPPLCQEQTQHHCKQWRNRVRSAPSGQIQERLGPSSGSKTAHKTDIYTCCQSTFTHLALEDVEISLFEICRSGANIPIFSTPPQQPDPPQPGAVYPPLQAAVSAPRCPHSHSAINAKKLHLDSTNLHGACAVEGAKAAAGGGGQQFSLFQ